MVPAPTFRILECGVSVVSEGERHVCSMAGSIYAFVNIEVRGLSIASGIASAPTSFDGSAKSQEIKSVKRAARRYESFQKWHTAFDHHRDRTPRLDADDMDDGLTAERAGFGSRLFDSAVVDALLKARKCSFFEGMADNVVGIEPVDSPRQSSGEVSAYLNSKRQTVSMLPVPVAGLVWRRGIYASIFDGLKDCPVPCGEDDDGTVNALAHLQDLTLRKFIQAAPIKDPNQDFTGLLQGFGFSSSGVQGTSRFTAETRL